ncbi:helix-turn-helix domain-containing protein [Marinactinospora rubrisoli]|uniref:Helix-turn-helix domain-containing protein n=1 Tax=Marinactinospora rubrisoli TaxID=2715399 RepID=A0ABW2KIQ8_9ACTN
MAIRESLAFGKALYDRRNALGLSVPDLAGRAAMTIDEIECIKEGGTAPTVTLLRRLAAALNADVRLTAGHDIDSVRFEPHAAGPIRMWEGALGTLPLVRQPSGPRPPT